MTEMSLFEAINTQRAILRYKPDPVPDEAITKILAAATRAPSACNSQPWYFLALRDAELRRSFGEIYWKATQEGRSDLPRNTEYDGSGPSFGPGSLLHIQLPLA